MKSVQYRIGDGKLASVIGGQIISRIEANGKLGETGKELKVVVPKSIHGDGSIEPSEMQTILVREDAGKYENRLTLEGDIVIKLSPPYDAAIVTKETEGCLIPSFCAAVRCHDEDYRLFFLAFLNSRSCKDQLKASVAGSLMQLVSSGKIKELNVFMPSCGDGSISRDECVRIGEMYGRSRERLEVMRKIQQLEAERNDLLFKELEEMS